jgi:23S rRNA pseudouridine1911/1915/1917 synthase
MSQSEIENVKAKEDPESSALVGGVADEGEEILVQEGNEAEGEHLTLRVGSNLKFRRLDKYLGGRFNNLSRTRIQKLIRSQGVTVNGNSAKPSHKLNAKDEIDLVVPAVVNREMVAEDIPINVIFEDDDIIVINKQSNLIVHPARGHKSGTLVNGLMFYFKDQLSTASGDEMRPGIVHRLDRNTTGVMIVAKSDRAHYGLSRQFANRTTKKTYMAICHGTPDLNADCINLPIAVHPKVREKMAVVTGGKESITFYEVAEKFKGYSLMKVGLKTGRTHQIRVHLSHMRHSIVADDMYGGKTVFPWQVENRKIAIEEPLMGRVALHAWQLIIRHPGTDEEMTFEADLPPDMQKFLDELRKHREIEKIAEVQKRKGRISPHRL